MFTLFARIKPYFVFGGLTFALLFTASAPMLDNHDVDAKKRKHRQKISREVKNDAGQVGQLPDGIGNPDTTVNTKGADIAIQDIVLASNASAGHRTVVVKVKNVGLQSASNFTIGMVAWSQNGSLRNEVKSAPLSVPAGGSKQVEFTLGCNWINNGTIAARTNPTPVQGEWSMIGSNVAENNARAEGFGSTACQ